MSRNSRRKPAWRFTIVVVACASFAGSAAAQSVAAAAKMPITTSSDEARRLYLQGRDLAEALRAIDARKYFEQAVAKDRNFALAYIGLANTSGSTKASIDGVARAVALADGVSEGSPLRRSVLMTPSPR